ncbi:hypothetical protein F7F05_30620, partial [Escherichia coli]
LTFQNHTNRPLTDFGGKTSIFSHPVYLFLREFSLQDFRGGSDSDQTVQAVRLRKIHDVHVRIPSALTEEALEQIGQLYAIEADIRGMPAEQRLA